MTPDTERTDRPQLTPRALVLVAMCGGLIAGESLTGVLAALLAA